MNNKSIEVIFGEAGLSFIPITQNIAAYFSGYKYEFMPDDKFNVFISQNPSKALVIYWREILYRAHLVSVTSILRNMRWMTGMVDSYENSNYLAFAASFRGFIESAGDTTDALINVPLTLAENFTKISSALNSEMPAQAIIVEGLEDILIHYIYGRKVPKNSGFPDTHNAKTNRDYLSNLVVKGDTLIHDCYSELCDITHPALSSVAFLIDVENNAELLTINGQKDILHIVDICQRYKSLMLQVMSLAFNPAMLTLTILNKFEIEEIKTPIVETVDLSQTKLWNKIDGLLQHK